MMKIKKDIVVMKFGGTSVGDIVKINKIAEKIIKTKNSGNDVVVVVSAMGHTTDELVELAKKITNDPNRREMDMLLSTGEQVSIALLSIAILEKGYQCISLTGSQAGILTDDAYSNAKILNINSRRIHNELKKGNIVIVAGFQGITSKGDISTLGRGGSDTTAVALAAALKAKYCDIYTDVEGVYTTDPNIVAEAKKIKKLSYEEMLELASSGAKVLHLRAVEFANKHNVIIHVRSSFIENEGTWILEKEEKDINMESALVTGVVSDTDQVKITIFGLKDIPGVAAKLFGEFASRNINVDLIVQNVSEKNVSTISFTIKNDDLVLAKKVLEEIKSNIEFNSYDINTDVSKVSIVGAGMQTYPGVAAKMFKLLADEDINIEMISTSPIRISCIVKKEKVKAAVKALHSGFSLGQ